MLQKADSDGGGVGSKRRAEAEDVISKMKDDGDFDRLRLKIIRKLRDNEELRSNIISMVRQSAALNRRGAESMKPRQLADAIHQEIGEKIMSQISDGLWSIIRSPEGMKAEISDTVKSVHSKLNPNGNANWEPSLRCSTSIQGGVPDSGAIEANGALSDGMAGEPPPGAASTTLNHPGERKRINQPRHLAMPPVATSAYRNSCLPQTPSVASAFRQQGPLHTKDEDPDVPPGFG